MPDHNERRRRPVDALFGDRHAESYPSYVVESPRPVTTVSPPPPDPYTPPTPAPASTAPSPAVSTGATGGETPQPVAIKEAQPTEPVATPGASASEDRISQLYDEVRTQLGNDMRGVARECMDLLLKARMAGNKGDNANAEFYIELVEARLAQGAMSRQTSRRPIVWVIWIWNVGMLVVAASIVVITYVSSMSLFGLTVAPELVVLLRVIACGIIGAALGTMVSIIGSLRRRTYDPANELGYFAKPVIGGELGIMFFIPAQAIAAAASASIGAAPLGQILLYLLAGFTGFGQESILELFRRVMERS